MDKITQTARYRQSLIFYAEKHRVTKAAIRYRTNRQYIYRWRRRYDGTLQSLEDRPTVHTVIPISTPQRNSSSFGICAAGIPTPVLSRFCLTASCEAKAVQQLPHPSSQLELSRFRSFLLPPFCNTSLTNLHVVFNTSHHSSGKIYNCMLQYELLHGVELLRITMDKVLLLTCVY